MITFLARALKVLFVLLVVRLVLRGIFGLARPATPQAGQPRQGELVRDRVCNTFVPRDRALLATIAGHEEHFCSVRCRDLALASGPA